MLLNFGRATLRFRIALASSRVVLPRPKEPAAVSVPRMRSVREQLYTRQWVKSGFSSDAEAPSPLARFLRGLSRARSMVSRISTSPSRTRARPVCGFGRARGGANPCLRCANNNTSEESGDDLSGRPRNAPPGVARPTSFEGVRIGLYPPPSPIAVTSSRARSRERPPALTRISSTMLALPITNVRAASAAFRPRVVAPRRVSLAAPFAPSRIAPSNNELGGAAIVGASGARARRAVPLRATASSSRADGDALDRVPRAFDPLAVVEDPIPAADAEPPSPWWREALRRLAAPALGLAVILATFAAPMSANAAISSGRMGGSNFRSSSSAPSVSRSYSSSSFASGDYIAPAMTSSIVVVPTTPVYVGGGAGVGDGGAGLVGLVFAVVLVLAFLDAIKNALGGDGVSLGGDSISVVKIQIGLLGMARQLQLDLEDIADKADTSSIDGLHYVLEETVLALLRNPEYCVYGYATSSVAKGPEAAEDLFNEMSMDERGKFEEETLVNVNARKKAVAAKGETAEGINEYILVTIIAASDGGLKLPPVQDATELRTALKRVGAIRADALQAVEVLWTPQEEGDTLSEDELLGDYPQLNIL